MCTSTYLWVLCATLVSRQEASRVRVRHPTVFRTTCVRECRVIVGDVWRGSHREPSIFSPHARRGLVQAYLNDRCRSPGLQRKRSAVGGRRRRHNPGQGFEHEQRPGGWVGVGVRDRRFSSASTTSYYFVQKSDNTVSRTGINRYI